MRTRNCKSDSSSNRLESDSRCDTCCVLGTKKLLKVISNPNCALTIFKLCLSYDWTDLNRDRNQRKIFLRIQPSALTSSTGLRIWLFYWCRCLQRRNVPKWKTRAERGEIFRFCSFSMQICGDVAVAVVIVRAPIMPRILQCCRISTHLSAEGGFVSFLWRWKNAKSSPWIENKIFLGFVRSLVPIRKQTCWYMKVN